MKAIRNLKMALTGSFLALTLLFAACQKDPVTDASAQNGGTGDAGTFGPQKTNTVVPTSTNSSTPTNSSAAQSGSVAS